MTHPLEEGARFTPGEINAELLLALQILERYTSQLIDCGDCGNWSSDETEPVTRARAAISKARGDLP
jgi:hypothetical protein